MKTLVAMIRGINVTGRNMVPMEGLRTMVLACGCVEPRTYIQSGNVVFRTEATGAACAASIAQALEKRLGKQNAVIVRTPAELRAVIRDNPFLRERGIDTARLSVSFLSSKPASQRLQALSEIQSGRDRFAAHGKEVYLHTPDGFGISKLASAHERVLQVATTVRNWRTVLRLEEMTRSNDGN